MCILFSFICEDLDAQRLNLRSKEVGLNMTPLLTQVIPFSNGTRRSGPFGFMFRSGRNGKYFNFELGVQLFDVDNDTQENYFNMAIGIMNKRPFGKKFVFYSSYNLVISAGSFNEPNDPSNNENVSLGLSYGPGIEYHITDYFYLATEAHLFAGVTNDFFRIHVVPPLGLFLIIKLK